MRVLLDEHLPLRLAGVLADHEAYTVRAEGWSGTNNGALLAGSRPITLNHAPPKGGDMPDPVNRCPATHPFGGADEPSR